MKSMTWATLGALTLLAGAACMKVSESVESATRYVITGHPGGAYEPKNVNKYNLEDSAKFVLLDPDVERSVTCSSVRERVLEDGRLEVTVNVRNRINRQPSFPSSRLDASCTRR